MKPKSFLALLALLPGAVLVSAQEPSPPPPPPSEQQAPAPPAAEAAPTALDTAKARFKEGNFTAALEAAEASLAEQPDGLVAHYIAGTSLVRLSRLDEADPHLKAVLEKAPGMPGLHFQLGFLAYRRAEMAEKEGKHEEVHAQYLEAAKDFAVELEKAPTQVASLSSRAAALARAGEAEEAIRAHEAWIAVAPATNEPYLSLAGVYATESRVEEALAQLDRLPNKDPKIVADATLGLAQSLYTHGQYGDAVSFATKAVELDPSSARALSLLVAAHANKGNVDETALSLKKYLAMNPPPAELTEVADVIAQGFGEDAAVASLPAGVTPPAMLKPPKPRYPTAARAKIETKVLLFAEIRPDGTVGDVIVVPSRLGKDLVDLGFADAAIDAAKRGRYKAGDKNGQPAAMYLPLTMRFVP